MIVVSDNEGDRVEVGESRHELMRYLEQTCSDDYADEVLEWFDNGREDPLVLDNGIDGVLDTWVDIDDDDDLGDEDYDDGADVEEDDEEAELEAAAA